MAGLPVGMSVSLPCNMFRITGKQQIVLLLTLTFCAFALCQGQCVKISPCVCQYPDGKRVDLTSVGNTNGTARFLNIPTINTSEPYTYSYNPCFGFDLGDPAKTECKDVAACQKSTGSEDYYSLGKQDSGIFWMNGSQLTVNYTSIFATPRKAIVKLVCDNNGNSLEVEGEFPSTIFTMTLHSPCACPDGCLGAPYPDDALSTGSVLVILLFIFLLCYLVGGIIFQKIVIGATGRELIPNYEFWVDFPLLVRDGVIFVCNGCQSEASYDRI